MKILVLSDSHGNIQALLRAVSRTGPDMILHLGDYDKDCLVLRLNYPQIPLRAVRGNGDPTSKELDDDEFVVEGKRIFMTHGHKYGVKNSLSHLMDIAESRGADILLFGHTHIRFYMEYEGMHIINPGCLGHGSSSYGVLTIRDGVVQYSEFRDEM